MANQSLTDSLHSPQTHHYSIKEFQLLVKDAPVVPAEIQPFVGVSFCSSADIYRRFQGLASGLLYRSGTEKESVELF